MILIGRITGAHGIRGELVIASRTHRPEDVAAYGPVSDAIGSWTLKILSARVSSKGVIARMEGIADRNAADSLKGTDLYVARDRLPPPADGEYYAGDLVGLEVFDPEGRGLGRVVDVPNFGAGDLFEIDPGDGKPSFLVTVTDDTVPEIDIVKGRIVVAVPADAEDT
jgi:16S rRNA processing protein RimM